MSARPTFAPLPPGARDLLPPVLRRRRRLQERALAVFVTSKAYPGNLIIKDPQEQSGLRGADEICRGLAEDALLPQSELFMRRSEDGASWASEVRLTESPDLRDGYPVAVADPQPGFVDLYWTRDSVVDTDDAIVHQRVATDTIFTSRFGD